MYTVHVQHVHKTSRAHAVLRMFVYLIGSGPSNVPNIITDKQDDSSDDDDIFVTKDDDEAAPPPPDMTSSSQGQKDDEDGTEHGR